MLYIVCRNTGLIKYMLQDISHIYPVIEIKFNHNLMIKIIWKILGRFIINIPFLHKFIFDSSVYPYLRDVKKGDTVLLLGCVFPSEFYAITKSVPQKCKLYQWFWNPLVKEYGRKVHSNLKFLKKLGYTIYTFDPSDAKKYRINYHNQFGRKDVDLLSRKFEIQYDFYFLGKSKGRQSIISELQMYINDNNYRGLFIIVQTPKDVISYKDNIENILKSSCVIDIVQIGQAGLTLRPIESLFYRKKLLTNNIEIKKYDFYNKNNIFILGEDDINTISTFLKSQYIDIPYSVMSKYMIEEWVNIFV